MTSYLLLMTLFTKWIQALQHQMGDYGENKPRLLIFHDSIIVSQWTFLLTPKYLPLCHLGMLNTPTVPLQKGKIPQWGYLLAVGGDP